MADNSGSFQENPYMYTYPWESCNGSRRACPVEAFICFRWCESCILWWTIMGNCFGCCSRGNHQRPSIVVTVLSKFLFCLCFLTHTIMIQAEESNTSKICKMDPCYHQGKCDCQVKFYAVGARTWYPVVSHETESLHFLLTKGSSSPLTIVRVFLIQSYIYNYDDMMVKWTFMWSFLLIPIYSLKSYSLASSLCMNRPIQLKPCHLPYISTLLLQTQTNVCIHLCSWHA